MVARLYPSDNPSSGRFRKRSIYSTGRGYHDSRWGGCFNVRGPIRGRGWRGGQGRWGHVRGGRGGDSGTYENRIDISYVTCYFEDLEWSTLSNNTSKSITDYLVRTNILANKRRCTTISVSVKKEGKRLIYHIITEVQNSIRNESLPMVAGKKCLMWLYAVLLQT